MFMVFILKIINKTNHVQKVVGLSWEANSQDLPCPWFTLLLNCVFLCVVEQFTPTAK